MKDYTELIFIAGVHGVGKNTLCKKIENIIDAEHTSASNLIRKRKILDQQKSVKDVLNNQDILIQEVNSYKTIKRFLLLDGHFCLYNSLMEIIKIQSDVFNKIGISKILLLVANPQKIYERIINRDKNMSGLNLDNIEKLQQEEIQNAYLIAKKLKIPIMEVNIDDGLSQNLIENILFYLEGDQI